MSSTRINVQPDELQLAASVLSLSNIFEIKYSAPVRLYRAKANGSNWTYANSYGIVAVTLVQQSVVMIRLVDLKTKSITMEQECYEGFEYQTLSSNFHAFESDSDYIGLLFAERFDADQFAKQVCQLIRLKATGSINATSTNHQPSLPSKPTGVSSPTMENAPPTPVKRSTTTQPPLTPPPRMENPPPPVSQKPVSQQPSTNVSHHVTTTPTKVEPEKKHATSNSGGGSSSSGGGGFLSKFFGKNKGEQVPDRSQIKISGPKVEKFKHVSHIGFDPKLGFTEVPPELKSIFEKAGISEAELKDKKTAKFLMKTLVTVTENDVPPVPPSSGTSRPTPPTPNNRPPPPPFKGASSSGSSQSGSSAIGAGGGFVPPPPTNVPPPPMVDHSIKPRVSVASPATDDDGSVGGGGDLLSEIKNKKLRNVKQDDLPEFKNMAESDQNNLAAKIAGIMELRRGKVEYSSEEDDDDDDDWEL